MLRYPVILTHGLFGFDTIVGYPYWFGIKQAMEQKGANVHVAAMSSGNSPEVRGEQLLAFIEQVRSQTGAEKVNMLGHSQGGITIRYAAGKNPGVIASLTSVSTPHHGSEIADIVRRVVPGGLPEHLITLVTDAFAKFIAVLSGHPELSQETIAALETLTSPSMKQFNKKYPNGLPKNWGEEDDEYIDGIYYYSWSGYIGKILDQGPNLLDPGHMPLRVLSGFFIQESKENDGLVGRFSSHFGKVIKSDYSLDHLDAVNQIGGLVPLNSNPVKLYADHVDLLTSKGL